MEQGLSLCPDFVVQGTHENKNYGSRLLTHLTLLTPHNDTVDNFKGRLQWKHNFNVHSNIGSAQLIV